MPSTKTPREGKPGPVSYNPMFPANAAQDTRNQRARVAVGDKEVQAIVNRDIAYTRQHTDEANK